MTAIWRITAAGKQQPAGFPQEAAVARKPAARFTLELQMLGACGAVKVTCEP